jgi:2-keto-4-pentenoate hydratase/2-oxohepta-3-ene-1,7-dioic acid hydratase in catechol pathway
VTRGRLATVTADGESRYGLVTRTGFVNLSGRFGAQWPTLRDAIVAGALNKLIESGSGRPDDFSLDDIVYGIPVPNAEKIICVGINYPGRNEEFKDGQAVPANPSLFPRFARSFVGHGQSLNRPPESRQLDYEGEIAIVIGKPGRRIPESQALDHISAVSLCNEGTIRDWARHAKFNVTQGKNFDETGAIGPWLVPFEDEEQLADIRLVTRVNGVVRQDDRTSRMIFPFRKLINYISTFTTLISGDVVVTGTPTGAGARSEPPVWLAPGDAIEVEAEGIGILRNGVADEETPV